MADKKKPTEKTGLGRDVDKSLETMMTLKDALNQFGNINLKSGILKIDEEEKADLHKMLDKASVDAVALYTVVENIIHMVRKLKPAGSTSKRFMSASTVIQRFLADKP
jgi:cell division FtsZ-interacting protein ZapD